MSRLPSRASSAFSLIELAVIIVTLILVVIFLPFGLRARKRQVLRENCVNNLKQIGLAYRTWSTDSSDVYPQKREVTYGGSKEWLAAGQLFLHFRTMSNELSTTKVLVCPADKEKSVASTFGQGFTDANVSYFASMDSVGTLPESILSGDRNWAVAGRLVSPGILVLLANSTPRWTRSIHDSCGNVGLGDGSVQMLDQTKLATAIANQGIDTNRLAFP